MNINVVGLVSIGIITGLIVMCKDSWLNECVHINSTFLGHDSLPLVRFISLLLFVAK